MPSEPVQVLLEVAALLERLGIPYLVGGSMASSVQAERLDLAYLRGWAERLGLSDLLSRAISEADVDRAR